VLLLLLLLLLSSYGVRVDICLVHAIPAGNAHAVLFPLLLPLLRSTCIAAQQHIHCGCICCCHNCCCCCWLLLLP
jgi:hypothetical protein